MREVGFFIEDMDGGRKNASTDCVSNHTRFE